jgi:hypothetical protein
VGSTLQRAGQARTLKGNATMTEPGKTYVAFAGHKRIATDSLSEVARAVRLRLDEGETSSIAVFDAASGAHVDLDLRGSPEEVATKAAERERAETHGTSGRAGPGRPKLGVVGREVTLLPRHWDWLAAQPGGASVTLRKLVDMARKQTQGPQEIRRAQDAAYRFMHAMAGNLPGFEEATRALYAWDLNRMAELIAPWPPDVRDEALALVRQVESVSQER